MIKGKYTDAIIFTNEIENEALSQIYSIVNHPVFTGPVRIMPDVHAGAGCVIGFTAPLTNKIIPSIIGYDIGCGVSTCILGKIKKEEFLDNWVIIDKKLREIIPLGQNTHEKSSIIKENKKFFEDIFKSQKQYYLNKISNVFNKIFKNEKLNIKLEKYFSLDYIFKELPAKIGLPGGYIFSALGTLGGGNHFIEVEVNESDDLFVTIHTGSRNLGKKIAEYWQKKAIASCRTGNKDRFKKEIELLKMKYKGKDLENAINDLKVKYKNNNFSQELSYLSSPSDVAGYLIDMFIAQIFATYNRYCIYNFVEQIISYILKKDNNLLLDDLVLNSFESVHNYVDFDDLIIRKGAIKTPIGKEIIIPLNMKDGVIIAKVKNEPIKLIERNFSAPHGAGRKMSRSKAKQSINLNDFRKSMVGIASSSVNETTLDESPMAYKDKDNIITYLNNIADIVYILKPIYVLKDSIPTYICNNEIETKNIMDNIM
ncbi:conserved hypothetical protein (plasmid) [Deferribacter desulfuricans SSM1]|uniref:3'-phosphate/5'-hydroxy nucleic acid ligase n=1 Tax=Deferribacter desulfuricans (strain DSM 14783 / JCM 11476 / NBRC 101012 / SSM1) TaxID=639282 RepID=D3PEV9_DEFDS|nr:RNA-splicing ligase RtcB [Deferribacter desulfuricans]BAI81751.1 conserved hypothetical protein [Deferribacter desulfuricans SSM1]